MKNLAIVAALMLLPLPALAQTSNVPPGVQPNRTMSQPFFSNGSDSSGFSESSMNPAVVAAGTTQLTATILPTRVNVITSCPAGAGVQLPAVSRYTTIVILNRSGNSCLVYPTVGATLETAPATAGAVNAPFTLPSGASATNPDIIFRPISATAWVQ